MSTTDRPDPPRRRSQRARETPPCPFEGVYDTAALAAALGVAPSAVRMWAAGTRRPPEDWVQPQGMLNGGLVWAGRSIQPLIDARRPTGDTSE